MFVDMVSPKEWGAMKDYDSWDYGPWNVDKWVVHYGGGANRAGDAAMAEKYGFSFPSVDAEMEVLRAWERYHVNGRGWLGIAYNYAVGQSGNIYRLRGENQAAATKGDYEPDGIPENQEARAVVFILGGTQTPTDEALASFVRLYNHLGGDLPVIVHSDVKDTQCPGDFLRDWVHNKKYLEVEDMWVKQGDSGFTVEFWQLMLQKADPTSLSEVTKQFDDATVAAVRKVTNRYVSGIGPTEAMIIFEKAFDNEPESVSVLDGKVDSIIERIYSVEQKLAQVKEVL